MVHSKLRRVSGARKALLRSLTTELFRHGRIETTETKAKELARSAAKMITLAKRGDLHARRQVLGFVMDETVTKNLFDEIAKKYEGRTQGRRSSPRHHRIGLIHFERKPFQSSL